ncbi:MAG: hypothetical protein U0835_06060 [Isosphaeraceae bacterium]
MPSTMTSEQRDAVAAELLKLIELERSLAANAKARAQSPPMPELGVLYHEIAEQDERHVVALETISTRYGNTPTRGSAGGVGETIGRLKEKVVELASEPFDLIRQDLEAKADAIHLGTAWAHALASAGDAQSAKELQTLLDEDQAHRDALLEGLKRLAESRVHLSE